MSAPEAPGTAFDTLILEPARPAGPVAARVGAPAPAPARKRFTELDGLRGVAAPGAVVFHLNRYIPELDPPRKLERLISGGDLMVDLFFVLSGFVLARTMLATRTPGDVVRFSSLRARRFLPL